MKNTTRNHDTALLVACKDPDTVFHLRSESRSTSPENSDAIARPRQLRNAHTRHLPTRQHRTRYFFPVGCSSCPKILSTTYSTCYCSLGSAGLEAVVDVVFLSSSCVSNVAGVGLSRSRGGNEARSVVILFSIPTSSTSSKYLHSVTKLSLLVIYPISKCLELGLSLKIHLFAESATVNHFLHGIEGRNGIILNLTERFFQT